jgi:pyruvate ferredoxin oxidoreductase alpha subunit
MVEVAKTLPRVTEEQKRLVALSGNEAQAEAMRQINPDVVAAYPITPQTEIVMQFAQFVADGKVDTEYIPVESEHSAMSACIGAAAAGARAMTQLRRKVWL